MHFLVRRSTLFLGTLALLVAAALRLAQVGAVPPGLHYDEAADTIIAREIAEGRSAPLFVEAYTGKEVLFFYWAAAWMKVAGATPFAMRLAAAMMGVLTVAATYWAVREMFRLPRASASPRIGPDSGAGYLALLAATLMATSFWHVLLSRVGFRSIAEPCLQALAIAALWRGARLNHRRWLIAGGGLVGLNLYTYLAARLFPVAVAGLFIYLFATERGHRRERLLQFGLVILSAALVFAPLGIYFAQHPGAFLTRIEQVAPREGQDVPANILRALGMFFLDGDPYVRFNMPDRPLFPTVLGILFIVGALFTAVGIVHGRQTIRRAAYMFVLTSTVVMLLPTALAVNEITPSNLRAIGMMPAVFVLPALGTWSLLKALRHLAQRMKTTPKLLLRPPALIVFILLAVGLETRATYFDSYIRLPELYYQSDGDLVDIARRLSKIDAARIPIYVHALHYRHPTLAALAREFHLHRSLTGPDVLVFPTGESLQVFAHLALPDTAWLARFLSSTAQVEIVPGPDGQPAYVMVHADAQPVISPQMPLDANFADTIRLIGADLQSAPRSGGIVDVTLYWRVLRQPDRGDYALFVELRDRRAYQFEWGRADSFDYPSEQWAPGELIVQRIRVPVASGAPPDQYQLRVGWYSESGDVRLPVWPRAGQASGTTAQIYPIPVGRATQPPDEESLGMSARLHTEMIPGVTLLGVAIQTPDVPQSARLFFTLFWRVERAGVGAPVEVRTRALATGQTLPLTAGDPVYGSYPFNAWAAGEVVADRYGIYVQPDAPPGEHALEARVGTGAWIEIGRIRIVATDRRFDVPPIAHSVQATFGNQIALLGYDLDRPDIRPGQSLTLTLVWRALKTPDDDYTVFTHLLDAAGVQRGGKDNPPVGGAYPTSRWIKDEVIVDTYVITLEADAPPGEYAIEVGFYTPDTGERLPLSTGSDALRVTPFQVNP